MRASAFRGTLAGFVMLAAACSDNDVTHRFPSEPGTSGPPLREGSTVVTTGRLHMSVFTKHGPISWDDKPFTARGIIRNGVALTSPPDRVDSTSDVGSLPLLALTSSGRLGLGSAGGRRDIPYTDSVGRVHRLSILVGADGAPAQHIEYYLNGVLRHTTSLTWTRTTGGWLNKSAVYREYRQGRLIGVASVTSDHAMTVSAAGSRRLTRVLSLLAVLTAPASALAQAPWYFKECATEWGKYIEATAALAALYDTIVNAPEVTPTMLVALAAATKLAAQAEMALFVCVDNQTEIHNAPGGGGGGSGPVGAPPGDGGGAGGTCASGSAAAHCQHPNHPL